MLGGHGARRGSFVLEHVPVEVGRPPDGLAGVVDDEVEPASRREQVCAERFDTRRVAQVEAEDLEPVAPVREVRLLRVPRGRVAREAGRDDEVRSRAQELDACLVADLHAPAGEERHSSAQVGGLAALGEVEVAARRAHLVVERVDLPIELLADVTVLGLDRLAELGVVLDLDLLEADRRVDVRRREDGPVAQDADAGLGENRFVLRELGGLLAAAVRLVGPPPGDDVGVEDVAGGGEEPRPLVLGQRTEQPPVSNDRLERLGGQPQPLGRLVLVFADRH